MLLRLENSRNRNLNQNQTSAFLIIFFFAAAILPIIAWRAIATHFSSSPCLGIAIASLSVGVIAVAFADTRNLLDVLLISLALTSFQVFLLQLLFLNSDLSYLESQLLIETKNTKSYWQEMLSVVGEFFQIGFFSLITRLGA